MKKVLKCISLAALAVFFVATVAACGDNGAAGTGGDGTMRIAQLTHSPDTVLHDGSFNEGAWNAVDRFMNTHNLPADNFQFFIPHESSDIAHIDLMADAISGGADILVLPGFMFEASSYAAQDMFPDTSFVLLDASPTSPVEGVGVRVSSNLVAIHYAEHESGFLAGYAAVMEGYRGLGFMGGIAVPPVVRYGHGFVQGAEFAAQELGLAPGEVTIQFAYAGGFAPDPGVTTTVAAWFASGTEVVFAAAGGAGFSVFAAAEAAGGSTIGVDVDQFAASPTVITSALKGIEVSVYDMLTDFLNDNFVGGREIVFDASMNGVGLAMENSRFQNFTQAQYNAIFARLASGEISVSDSIDPNMAALNLSLVTIQ